MTQTSHNPNETKKIAADFSQTLKGGDIVVLKGDLGSGKTTFVQGLAESLGVASPVTSPTFIGMQLYNIPSHPSIKTLCHIDAYRFQSINDVISAGLDEYLGAKDILSIIEWPQQLFGQLQKPHKTIEFQHQDESARLIEIKDK
ncbi:MAG: tRNA (adenosine(37)-N6)-threonylcarbamoyltransferase complex ATPase subunit type 1 TsaE [bacterium]|nr:tRNA (adenosine(37)-N6)-threonylcarbamoyltransferase complex ATPase subunit type 1 TsaE [bacterium]